VSDPVAYVRIAEGTKLPDITGYAPFRAIVVLDAAYSKEWQTLVSEWLVASGCLYMMAWGENCSSWDDSVDWANIEAFNYEDIPEESFVMTTWHEKEPLIGAFWFARFCAHDPYDLIEHSLIVHVGTSNREAEFLSLYEQAETWDDQQEGLG
jgi:hypothetical protein